MYNSRKITFRVNSDPVSESPSTTPKCSNHEICKMEMPDIEFIRGTKDNSYCILCSMLFGNSTIALSILESVDCPICMNSNIRGVRFPNCVHSACINCFHRCFYGDGITTDEPAFPIPELENEYRSKPDLKNWKNYPDIIKYCSDWNSWFESKQCDFALEGSLRRCPICRL